MKSFDFLFRALALRIAETRLWSKGAIPTSNRSALTFRAWTIRAKETIPSENRPLSTYWIVFGCKSTTSARHSWVIPCFTRTVRIFLPI